jgi:hypothetical protein
MPLACASSSRPVSQINQIQRLLDRGSAQQAARERNDMPTDSLFAPRTQGSGMTVPRRDMTDHEFVFAVMDECLELAYWGARVRGSGAIVADRRAGDSYTLSWVPAARFLSGLSEARRQEVLGWLSSMEPYHCSPEMGLVMQLISGNGSVVMQILPPRTACRCPTLQ